MKTNTLPALTLNNTFPLTILQSLSSQAYEMFEHTQRNDSAYPNEAALRELVAKHATAGNQACDVAISVTGLPRYKATAVLNTYQERIEAVRQMHLNESPVPIMTFSEPRFMTALQNETNGPIKSAIVFRINVLSCAYESLESRTALLMTLIQLSSIMGFSKTDKGSNRMLYEGGNIYQYRGWPCNIAPDSELWTVSGMDYLDGSGGVLEWCASKADAEALIEQMRQDGNRFKVSASKYLDGFRKEAA